MARKLILLLSLEKRINGRSAGPNLFGTNVAQTLTIQKKKMIQILKLSARARYQSGQGTALSSFIQVATCRVEDKAMTVVSRVLVIPALLDSL